MKPDENFKNHSTIWLADVKKFYYEKGINLGFIRKNNAPPRKYRPTIVVDKQANFYRVIFLTTKKGIVPVGVSIGKICNISPCPIIFEWQENSNVFINTSEQEIRKIFILIENDLNLMTFCGFCDDDKIVDLVNKIHSKVKAWKRRKKQTSFKF